MFSLTTTHLRFVCEATTPLRLEQDTFRAGSNLRGALGQVMLRAYCTHPDPKGFAGYAAHGDTLLENPLGLCPVHWLLAANLKPGEERRGYALVPPLPHETRECGDKDHRNAGDLFEFGLTLFGSAQQFLPYFILAVPEMGRVGIGPGRGKFELKRVWALNPLTGESECLFGDAGNLVRTPTLGMNHAGVKQIADSRWQMADGESQIADGESRMVDGGWRMADGESEYTMDKAQGGMHKPEWASQNEQREIENRNSKIEIQFLTPMRLIDKERTVKSPEFAPLFARLLERLDELEKQFGSGEGRTREEVMALREMAGRVELVEVNSRWVEVFSGSTRRGMASPLSGFVGRAMFSARREVWNELLPWLLWGELAQVGKGTVKGNGVMRIYDL